MISRWRILLDIIIPGCVLAILFLNPAHAEIPKPVIPVAKGEQCVEETGFIRRNHMDMLDHQRDKTMRKGIRTKKHSLQGCLNCHAVFDENQMAVDFKSEKHFCNACHSYAAVRIDCFDCHNSKPREIIKTGM